MICEHLRELERQLVEQGFSERFRGRTWPRDCREWVYFDCYMSPGVRERLPLDSCVEYHSNSERGESGFVCAVHHDAVIGHRPGSGVVARNFAPRRAADAEPPPSPARPRDTAIRREQLDELAAALRQLDALLDRDPACTWSFAGPLDQAEHLRSTGFTQRDLNDLSAYVRSSYGGTGSFNDYVPARDGQVAPWYGELDRARHRVYEAANALRTVMAHPGD